MNIRALIVDDEPLARRRLRQLLAPHDTVEILGECCDGASAITTILEQKPDLVFLDVQMPGLNGFDVVRALGPQLPVVIFVTAYDQYAVQAFEARALDFLLKPYNELRFRESLQRARQTIHSGRDTGLQRRILDLVKQVAADNGAAERLVVKVNGKHVLLRTSDVEWIEAEGDYARLHIGTASYLVREKMHSLESRFDHSRFVRVHRSTIVNLDFIRAIHAGIGGEYILTLANNTTLTASRTYRVAIQKLLEHSL